MSPHHIRNSNPRTTNRYYSTFTLLALVAAVSTYNLDVSRAKIFSDPNAASSRRSSYFGYSVALYVHQNVSLLLVGAPRANSSRRADKNDRVFEPGAVYRCDLSSQANNCTEWLLDTAKDNQIFGRYTPISQKKDSAWLGATVVVENSTNPRVVVCAPMWKTTLQRLLRESWFMNGMCYSVTASDSFAINEDSHGANRHFPLIDLDHQVVTVGHTNLYHYGMGEAGFSAHVVSGTHRLVIGAPGVFHWTGSAIVLENDDDVTLDSFDALVVPNVVGDTRLDYSDFLGYSITSGHFYEKNERLFASGAPRSGDGVGKVLVFSFPKKKKGAALLVRHVIKGEQYGEYFSSSLTACDVNGDGRDDLIVGSPLWSGDIEEGRVYAYVSEGQSNWKTYIINGTRPSGRFGSSLACLGDLDHDGFQDVAVGAPYEDEGQGAVYVYSGSGDRELFLKPSQRIVANNLLPLTPTLRGFGYSLSEPARDVDGDGFPDLAVGAYVSGHAVFLPSKPVVKVAVKLQRLDNASLAWNSTYFALKVCALYDGAYAPATFKATLVLKIDEFHVRAVVYENGQIFAKSYKMSYTLERKRRQCTMVKMMLRENVKNVVHPIKIVANLDNGEDPSCSSCPMINPTSKTVDSINVVYALDCGLDDVCSSDLQVNVTSSLLGPNNSYTIGSKSIVNVTVFVKNTKEPAYLAQARIYIPEPVTLVRTPPACKKLPQANKTSEIICDLDNPLYNNGEILMELNMNAIDDANKFKIITVSVTSQSQEVNPLDNVASLRINYDVDANLSVFGKSQENHYSYLESDIDEMSSKNFTFHHIYEVQKLGLTPIQKTEIILSVPVRFRNSEIVNVSYIRGSIDGYNYGCVLASSSAKINDFSVEKNQSLTSQDTILMNCGNFNVICQTFRCNVGPFLETMSVAELIVTVNFQISNDIVKDGFERILYVSELHVKIISPNLKNEVHNFMQISTNIYSQGPVGTSLWIIVSSIFLGLFLLIIMNFTLFKLGFFNRDTREDVQTLKSASGENQKNGEAMGELDFVTLRA